MNSEVMIYFKTDAYQLIEEDGIYCHYLPLDEAEELAKNILAETEKLRKRIAKNE